MAINVNTTHASLNLRIKFYSHEYYDNFTKLVETAYVKGIFYARKQGNTVKTNYVTQTGIKTERVEMTLYTDDYVGNLKQDDFILYNNEKWIVMKQEEVIVSRFRGKRNWQGTLVYVRK